MTRSPLSSHFYGVMNYVVFEHRAFPVCVQGRHQRPGLDLEGWVGFRVQERRKGLPSREEDVNKGRIELGGSGRGMRRAERALCAPLSLFHDSRQGIKIL